MEYDDYDLDDSGPQPIVTASPPSTTISGNATLADVKEADMQVYNFLLEALYAAWAEVNTIDKVCKMAYTTSDILKRRREALCLPTEHRAPRELDSPTHSLSLYS